MSLPLEGVRVVEVAQYVAGPLAGSLLAELGAEVIKVEPPGGDAYRRVMPVAPGIGRFFVPLNRGKRSIVLDLKSSDGRAALAKLIATAEVVVHNAPPARAEAFGIGWEKLHASHPALVVGIVTSFGPHGPLAGAPAYDLVAQGRSGLLTSHASHGDTVPVRAGGIPMADLTAGHLLATGVLAALVRARTTGEGHLVEVSLLGAALAVQIQDLVWLGDEAAGPAAPATRRDLTARADEIAGGLAMNPYYRCYEAADGFLAVACLNAPQRERFLGLFGLDDATIATPDLVPDDPAVLAEKQRVTATIEGAIAGERVEAWFALLGAASVPAGPVLARETVHADPQVLCQRPRRERRAAGPRARDDPRQRIPGRRGGSGSRAARAGARRRHRGRAGGGRRMRFTIEPELELFAESVRGALAGWEAPLEPVFGEWQDDRDDDLAGRLAEVGWAELWVDPDLLGPAVAGGIELGRAVAPLSLVDEPTLGVPLAIGGRVRHGEGRVDGGEREPTLDGSGTLRGVDPALPFDPERLRVWGAVTLALPRRPCRRVSRASGGTCPLVVSSSVRRSPLYRRCRRALPMRLWRGTGSCCPPGRLPTRRALPA